MQNKNQIFTHLAMDPSKSKGRLYADYKLEYRNDFYRDLNRIITCASFRRLEDKTQVFTKNNIKNHYRTRMTHSLEVAQVGRIIANTLGLSEVLTETLCLAHDLGHPPFGHAGENILDELTKDYGGFNHNVYGLKLLTNLEEKYIRFNGLNLTWETLEGIIKHNGPLTGNNAKFKLYDYVKEYNHKHDLALDKFPSLEAQVASIADDITYSSHDLEDGLSADLFSVEELYEAGIVNDTVYKFDKTNAVRYKEVFTNELTRVLKYDLIKDLIKQSIHNIHSNGIKSIEDVQNHSDFLIVLTEQGKALIKNISEFLHHKMYTHDLVASAAKNGEIIVSYLYNYYIKHPDSLPSRWQERFFKEGADRKDHLPIILSNYIASMTDGHAISVYNQFSQNKAIITL